MAADPSPGGLVQGTLHMLILKTLTLEPLHGYGIGVRLEQISDGGFRVNAGSLFPGVEATGARRPDTGRVARDREQPPREVLPPHAAGSGPAQARDATVGSADDRHRQNSRGNAGTTVMAIVQRFIGGLKGLLRSRRVEQDLDEELRAYLDSSVEAKVRAGMTPEDARRAARVELGSIEAVKDQTRERRLGSHGRARLARRAVCGAHAAQVAGVCRGGRAHVDAGHRRQYGHLQRRQRHHAARAPRRASGGTDLR